MKKLTVIAGSFLGLLSLLVGVLVVRTLLHVPPNSDQEIQIGAIETIEVNEPRLLRHMSESLRFKTISYQNEALPVAEFEGFIDWLIAAYPEVQARMELTRIGGYTLLYKWQGSDPSLKPVLLTGHYDVVPVIPGTEQGWTYPPYGGVVADGYVWGRGTLDDKGAVITMLEAATELIRDGYRPERTIYFSFGHDEEIGGSKGAGGVVEYARENDIEFLWSLDEGSFLFKDMIPGVSRLMGSINVAEKGSATIDIVAKAAGGHSSMPPLDNAVSVLATAINNLEKAPVPGGLDGLSADMFDGISRHMPFMTRMLFANQWLFKGLLEDQLFGVTFMNATLRTTTAPTMLQASNKVNVLPIEAVATVNFRLHPRDTVDSVVEHVKKVVDDERIEIRVRGGRPASAVSDHRAIGFKVVESSVKEVRPDAFMIPGLMIAGSDSKHYAKISENSYRFNPMIVGAQDLPKIHGTDENISIDNLVLATQVYTRIIQNTAP